jgi:hypothetical protein
VGIPPDPKKIIVGGPVLVSAAKSASETGGLCDGSQMRCFKRSSSAGLSRSIDGERRSYCSAHKACSFELHFVIDLNKLEVGKSTTMGLLLADSNILRSASKL